MGENMKIKKIICLNLIFLLLILISVTAAAQDIKRAPRLNFNGITGDNFIGQAGILYPFRNTEDSLWFTDLRYRMSEDDVEEWNLGLGYRKKIETAENHIAGIYVYKDRREEYGHYWDMWTVGGEILTDQWDFRVNGYITDDERKQAPELDSVIVENNQFIYQKGSYSSMDGLDIEFGKRFTETKTIFKNVGVYLKLYRFFESNTPTMTGRQIRIDKQFGDRDKITWKIGAQWKDDNLRGSETETTFAISIPFGAKKADHLNPEKTKKEIVESRMTEPPERDLDVVVSERSNIEEEETVAYDPATGERMDDIEYISAEADDLAAKINNSNSKVIILLGNNGDIVLSETIKLNEGQKLLSATGSLSVSADSEGDRSTIFELEGDQATLKLDENNFTGNSAIDLTKHNTVSGINIINSNSTNIGIYKKTLDVNNTPDIRNNKIKDFDIGIFFEEIAGDNNKDKMANLKKFNTKYEKMNEITGADIVVHDHLIKDWYDLNLVRSNLNGVYLMKANLDFSTDGYNELASQNADESSGWNPLGKNSTNEFSGHFDGQSYVISDVYINRIDEDNVGLFGYTGNNSIIENVGLEDADIKGNDNVGRLVGRNWGQISNSYATGFVTGSDSVGGLVGINYKSIENSYATGDVTGNVEVGGLVGENHEKISNSYANGDVTGNNYVGGLAGYSRGSIDNSYATGFVTGNNYVGGLVGINYGKVIDSISLKDDSYNIWGSNFDYPKLEWQN